MIRTMWKIILPLLVAQLLMGGCATSQPMNHTRQEIIYEQGKVQKFSYLGDVYGPNRGPAESSEFLGAIDILRQCDAGALPEAADLPIFQDRRIKKKKYIGLIENFTNYDISLLSANSGAALIIPAHGWLEYVSWQPNIKLIGYVDGKQVYYQCLQAHPKKYQYLGESYDFVAEIRPEKAPPLPKKPRTLKRKKKKKVCQGGDLSDLNFDVLKL